MQVQEKTIPFDHRMSNNGTFYDHVSFDEKKETLLTERIIAHLQKNPSFVLAVMSGGYQKHKKDIQKWKKVSQRDFSLEKNSTLAIVLRKYITDILSNGVYVAFPLYIEEYLEKTIFEKFAKHFGDQSQKWFGIAVDPIKDATLLQEEMALLRIAMNTGTSKKELQKHTEKYSWMKNTGYFEEYYDHAYYQRRLEKMRKDSPKKKLKAIEKYRATHRALFKKLLQNISDDSYLSSLVKTANEAVFFRSYRTEIYYSSARYFTNLFKEISRRINLSDYRDIVYLYGDEILNALKNSAFPNQEVITQRKDGYIFLSYLHNKSFHWEGKEAKRIFNLFKQSQSKQTQRKDGICGNGAYPGIAKGRVVLIHSLDDFHKVRKGAILVTHATNVNFVPILKKVSAIVTEEGGILSHAAIISRELKIPCIIGTRVATKVLKDGMLVEVDANKGIVRIIEQSENNKGGRIVDMTGWDIVPETGRAGWMYVIHTVGRYFTEPHPKWGVFTGGVVQNKNNKLQVYFTIKDNSKFEFTLHRFTKKKKLLSELEQFITDTKNAAIRNLRKNIFSPTISNDQLAKVTETYFSQYTDLHRAALILRLLDRGCMLKLREIFSQERDVDELIARVSVANRSTFSIQEEIEILELASKIAQSEKPITTFTSEMEAIMNAYQWLTIGYFDEKAKTYKDYENKLSLILADNPRRALLSLKERIAADLEKRDEIVKKIKSQESRTVIAIAGESTYLKDYFKFSINEVQFHGEALFEEIARRTKVPVSTLKNLMHDEITDLLKGTPIDLDLAKERIKHCVFVGKYDGCLHTMVGKSADIFEKRYLQSAQNGQKEFHGRSACKGKVTAMAKVVLKNGDFKKINQGDILIVMNTSPDFVPILRKSAAIVAEDGGITAHVSVISRELNIPCIVGISHITQSIEDGDLVEVDADQGTVKVLKRAKTK